MLFVVCQFDHNPDLNTFLSMSGLVFMTGPPNGESKSTCNYTSNKAHNWVSVMRRWNNLTPANAKGKPLSQRRPGASMREMILLYIRNKRLN